MKINPILYNANLYRTMQKPKQSFGPSNPIELFETAQKNYEHKILFMENKEYIIAKTKETQKPLIIRPDIVDTYLRDKNGEINKGYLNVFCNTYDEMLKGQKRKQLSVDKSYETTKELFDEIKKMISSYGIEGNVMDLSIELEKPKYLKAMEKAEYDSLRMDEYYQNKPKATEDDAFKKTVMFMQICQNANGYSFDTNEYNGSYEKRVALAKDLYSNTDYYYQEKVDKIIKASVVDEEKGCDVTLLSQLNHLCFYNDFKFEKFDELRQFLVDVNSNPENEPDEICLELMLLSNYVPSYSPDFIFLLNQSKNKNNNKFYPQNLVQTREMLKTHMSNLDKVKLAYKTNYTYDHLQQGVQIAKDYFTTFNDEQTGILRADAIDMNTYYKQKMAMLQG